MKKFKQNKILFLFFAMFFSVVSAIPCFALDPCFIKESVNNKNSTSGTNEINYFFDRTDSVGGFTQDGKETDYVRALYSKTT